MEEIAAYTALLLSLVALGVSIKCFRRNIKVVEYKPDKETVLRIDTLKREVDSIKEVVQVKSKEE